MIQALAPIQREQIVVLNGGDTDNTTDWVLDEWDNPLNWTHMGGDFVRLNSANFPGYAAQLISTGDLARIMSNRGIAENTKVNYYNSKVRLVVTFKYRSINKPLTVSVFLWNSSNYWLQGAQSKTIQETFSDTVHKAAVRFELDVSADLYYFPQIYIGHLASAAGNYLFEVDEVRLYQLSTKAQQTG